MRSTKDAHHRNWELSKQKGWTDKMREEIDKKKVKTLRIHVAGDFYSKAYINNWHRVVKSRPEVTFYAYTRSWNTEELLPNLVKLSGCSNMYLWWSDDHAIPEPPRADGVRIAYLSKGEDDYPEYPVNLVFREIQNKEKPVLKSLGPYGAVVCPPEQGIEQTKDITCQKCQLCYTERGNRVFRRARSFAPR